MARSFTYDQTAKKLSLIHDMNVKGLHAVCLCLCVFELSPAGYVQGTHLRCPVLPGGGRHPGGLPLQFHGMNHSSVLIDMHYTGTVFGMLDIFPSTHFSLVVSVKN